MINSFRMAVPNSVEELKENAGGERGSPDGSSLDDEVEEVSSRDVREDEEDVGVGLNDVIEGEDVRMGGDEVVEVMFVVEEGSLASVETFGGEGFDGCFRGDE